MNLREFYESIDTDYDALLNRLMNNEKLLEKYVGMFVKTPLYDELKEAIGVEDAEEIKRKAHTLKGMALNLGFNQLSECCAKIMHGDSVEIKLEFEKLTKQWEYIVSQLSK